jgi:hypothetical protein
MPKPGCGIFLLLQALVLFLALPLGAGATTPPVPDDRYGVLVTAWVRPGDALATVRIRLGRNPEAVRWMRLSASGPKYSAFKGSGSITAEPNGVLWRPSGDRPWLQYTVNLESKRESGRFDGLVTQEWAIFRADDLVPPVHLDMADGTRSESKLALVLPEGWSAVTPFPKYKSGRFRIENPDRLFDRPTGWVALGKLGVRRETINGTRLTIAAPTGQGVRRMDTLAFFRTSLPTVQKLFPDFPARLLVVSAGDPMWRGALSGPASLFVHADRPFISENGTSTFLHELVHVAMRARSRPDSDWIVEGLAEYYSLEILHRSRMLGDARFEKAHAELARWGEEAPTLDVPHSTGAVTAKAVGVLRGIDRDIRAASKGARSMDDVARALAATGEPVTRVQFEAMVAAAKKGQNPATVTTR